MTATGNEATRLSQLKSWWDTTIATINASINNKLDKPGTAATAGQVLSNNGTAKETRLRASLRQLKRLESKPRPPARPGARP